MLRHRHLTESEAWRILGWLEGQMQVEVAEDTRVSQSVISRIWNLFVWRLEMQFKDHGKVVGFNEDRYLTLTSRRHRNVCV
ncbi:hypothetical protein TNCV_5085121 [Trichonephila clavipes]|uniref:Uncharacterized protein n=1 Tax=Trichonephila clavipes TaxID=2585209 RepID=A0A8X6VIK5_TRICX|nr:hypothetical protein TNCV_5085121 [Trichonephila clavipes]